MVRRIIRGTARTVESKSLARYLERQQRCRRIGGVLLSVLKPRPTTLGTLLIDHILQILSLLLQRIEHVQSIDASSEDDYFQRT